jgi:HAD superfamily hydrolase (TIGR01509 family)
MREQTEVPLRALVVDVGGTLVDESGWVIHRGRYESLMLARLRDALGEEHHWFTDLIQYHFAQPAAPGWEQTTAAQIAGFLAARGMDASPENVERVRHACAVPLRDVVEVVEGAREAILEIRRMGIRIATCSNTWWRNDADSRQDWDVLGLGDCFDAHITSHDVGRAKPHPAIFERALAAVDVRPQQAAMIGDRPDLDVAGARAVGMRAIWLNPRAAPRADDPTPVARVARWGEVTPLVQAWAKPRK